jgi:hypothetical protein
VALVLLSACSRVWTVKVLLSRTQYRQELAKQILAYFLRHPKGADDLRGVATWRLLDQMIHQTLEETRDALEWLVSEGYLISDSTTGSERIFRLNKDKRKEAEQYLETDNSPNSSDLKTP